MMMMTLMTRTKFRPGIHKFYQPNSGLRGSKRWDEAIYIYIYIIIVIILYFLMPLVLACGNSRLVVLFFVVSCFCM